MAQHDYTIADADGTTFLADLNSALQAIATANSGTAAPATLYAGQMWIDTNTPSSTLWTLSIYSGSNHIPICYIDTTSNGFVPLAADGTAAAPGIAFAGDPDTGLYRIGANTIGLTAGGTLRVTFDAGGITPAVPLLAIGGNQSAPGYSFGGDSSTGFYNHSPSTMTVTVGGGSHSEFTADRFLVGADAAASPTLNGISLLKNGTLVVTRDNDVAAAFRRRNGDGTAVQFFRDGTLVGTIGVTTTGTSFNVSSDHRLKENLVPLTGALARLAAIPVYRGNFKATPAITQDLVLAHEFAAALPEAVIGEKDAVDEGGEPVHQGVDFSKAVPLLVAAVQELAARVAALEAGA